MGDPMTLRDEDVGRIGEYVKPWLREVVGEMVPHLERGDAGSQLLERSIRIEEELKAQRVLMDERSDSWRIASQRRTSASRT